MNQMSKDLQENSKQSLEVQQQVLNTQHLVQLSQEELLKSQSELIHDVTAIQLKQDEAYAVAVAATEKQILMIELQQQFSQDQRHLSEVIAT